ncbi:MAG: hypothetical protein ACXVJ1_16940 [Candidatus Angelobacter sp.]
MPILPRVSAQRLGIIRSAALRAGLRRKDFFHFVSHDGTTKVVP